LKIVLKPVIIIVMAFVILIPIPIFATSHPEFQGCDDFEFGEYALVEDYPLISELVSRGFIEKNLDTSERLLEYKGNSQYDSECQSLYKEYKQIGEEGKTWKNSCSEFGEFPNTDQVRELYYTVDAVCRFATLVAVEQTVDTSDVVCGKGTIEKNGQCVPEQKTKSSKGGGCLIATAAYGSEMAPQVQFLRELRDNTVLQTTSGTAFMNGFNQFYYSFSPQIADYERENPVFKEMVKISLTPLLTSLTLLNYVEIDSEEEMLGYGIGIILLNVGMYFVAPAVLIISLKKHFHSVEK